MSSRGNRFILVICDYATRYPEAVALRHIDAISVAGELLKLFSRVGVPKEILTDQGANFTSRLLVELYQMLHVQPIRTSPYHPQTDGLVERFNQTLKMMLRKAVVGEGKDWLCYPISFSHIARYLKHRPVFPLLSCYMDARSGDL